LASRRRDIDAALAAFVDRWLQTVRDDGRFKQLYAAWFE
jgi:ABC-type amino acid transport substrate-binding protein